MESQLLGGGGGGGGTFISEQSTRLALLLQEINFSIQQNVETKTYKIGIRPDCLCGQYTAITNHQNCHIFFKFAVRELLPYFICKKPTPKQGDLN